jgi:hypothetical protein
VPATSGNCDATAEIVFWKQAALYTVNLGTVQFDVAQAPGSDVLA